MYISINNIYHSLGGEMRPQKNEWPERDYIPDEAEGWWCKYTQKPQPKP